MLILAAFALILVVVGMIVRPLLHPTPPPSTPPPDPGASASSDEVEVPGEPPATTSDDLEARIAARRAQMASREETER
jgi:hypothetical protein